MNSSDSDSIDRTDDSTRRHWRDSLPSARVREIRRVFHTQGPEIRHDLGGPLEILFENDHLLRFEYSEMDEMMLVSDRPWTNPYEVVSIDSWASLHDVGLPRKFDISEQEPYTQVIGTKLVSVNRILSEGPDEEHLTGYRLRFDDLTLDVYGDAGDTRVNIPGTETLFEEYGFRLADANDNA